jgi:HxlR-like helix-turn-helix
MSPGCRPHRRAVAARGVVCKGRLNFLSALKRMGEHGLMTRRFYSDHPSRAAYTLTDKGRELGVVVGALAIWGARHVHAESTLVHTDCGTPVQMSSYCLRFGDRVRGNAVHMQQT